jgi:nitrogenase molybdenum-cofactor synthesis protein NifE
MNSLRQRTAPIREKRRGSIAAYSGSVAALLREAEKGPLPQRIRTFAQDFPSDLQYALGVLSTLDDVAIVVHGPAGCASWLRGRAKHWLVTGLTERDSILGGDAKLRQAILQANARFSPKLILVVATPVVAINNDDIESVTAELRDELELAIVPVFTDGFRSKIGGAGYDVAVHSLLKHLLPARPRARGESINLLAVGEGQADVAHLRGLLEETGLEVQTFPGQANIADIERIAEARLSVSIESDSGEYAGALLEGAYGVPFLAPEPPIGLAGTGRWLRAIADPAGRAEEAETVFERHRSELQAQIARFAEEFRGVSVYINLPLDNALGFARFARELGIEVVGLKIGQVSAQQAPLLDVLLSEFGDLPLLVGEGQVFEEVNDLRKLQPSLYLSRGNAAVHALRQGIAVLDLASVPSFGFAGAAAVIERLRRRLGNRTFQDFLSREQRDHYAPGWYAKRSHWYIKHEVK